LTSLLFLLKGELLDRSLILIANVSFYRNTYFLTKKNMYSSKKWEDYLFFSCGNKYIVAFAQKLLALSSLDIQRLKIFATVFVKPKNPLNSSISLSTYSMYIATKFGDIVHSLSLSLSLSLYHVKGKKFKRERKTVVVFGNETQLVLSLIPYIRFNYNSTPFINSELKQFRFYI